jgi:hypothetical protein
VDAEVDWDGRFVGHLRNVVIDQPYYRGEWTPAGVPEFDAALAARGWLPVTFRSADGAVSAPTRALVRPTPGVGVYFRFG